MEEMHREREGGRVHGASMSSPGTPSSQHPNELTNPHALRTPSFRSFYKDCII